MTKDYLMPTYPSPAVSFEYGSGARLTDTDGKQYLDFLAGLAVISLGHSHPKVAEALAKQSQKLLHVSNLYGTEHNNQLAMELDELMCGNTQKSAPKNSPQNGSKNGQVFFANSGAEANEAAIKLARKYGGHGKYEIISAYGSFHGRTLASLAATGQPEKHEAFAPMPDGFKYVEYGDSKALEAQITQHTAAVLIEPILGEGGVIPAPKGYLSELRQICTERGILLMFDEVQSGLGRTGNWFAHQYDEVDPDVVTIAKALGNGVPIGACWARSEVASVFEPGDHASTFGGQPLACAAALATLKALKDIDAPKRALELGAELKQQLSQLPDIAEVRGRGLMLAAELSLKIPAKDVAAKCLTAGLVVNAVTPTAVRFTPPLIIEKSDIDEAVQIFSSVLEGFRL